MEENHVSVKGSIVSLEEMNPKPMWVKKKEEMQANNRAAMKKLVCVTILTLIFVTIEIIGGIWSNSIAVISDAAHLLSDVLGIGVSIWALHIS